MVNMKEVFIDSTHVKANANKKIFIEQEVKKNNEHMKMNYLMRSMKIENNMGKIL